MIRNNKRRVVVTGLGVVSSIGIGRQEFWKNLIAGKSGISEVEAFDTSAYDRHYAGEVKNFDPAQFIDKKRIRKMGRSSQMAVAASKLALEDAGLTKNEIKERRGAVSVGTTTGEIALLERWSDYRYSGNSKNLTRDLVSAYPASSISQNVAAEFDITGNNTVFSTACAAGNYALGYASDLICSDVCDFAIVGGADPFSRIVFTGFNRLFAVAPEKCQPFDKNRKGMIPGEGAAILILESLDSALNRGASIYAEVLGYGLSCNANHMTSPLGQGIAKAMKKAIEYANIALEDVDYISAHGTGTQENDKAESQAFNNVFKGKMKDIPVSSIKSMLGHTMGAASAIESIACCLSVKNNQIPPTINLEELDDECDINCVPNTSIEANVKVALNNSSAFGGNNSCVAFGKYSI